MKKEIFNQIRFNIIRFLSRERPSGRIIEGFQIVDPKQCKTRKNFNNWEKI